MNPHRTRILARLRRRLLRLPNDGQQDGFAMILVIGSMLVLSIVAVAGLDFATQQLPTARHEQDYQAAGAATEAGIDDYLHHLNVCDDYWQGTSSTCYASLGTNAALQANLNSPSWTSAPKIAGTNGGTAASYLYSVISTPSNGTGGVQVEVKGHIGKVTRTVYVDFTKPSLLKYIYYTDIEALDPAAVPFSVPAGTVAMPNCFINTGTTKVTLTGCLSKGEAVTDATTACGYHYYVGPSAPDAGGGTTTGSRSPITYTVTSTTSGKTSVSVARTCDIQFANGDTITGPLHSNDALDIGDGPVFTTTAETSWGYKTYTNPAPADPAHPFRPAAPGYAPSTAGKSTTPAAPIGLPPNNAAIKQQVISPATGCLYTGPTIIKLNPAGTMTVTSPYTKSTNPGCGSFPTTAAQTVSLPANGVVFDQAIPASSSDPNYSNITACVAPWVGGSNGYPMPADVQSIPVPLGDGETTCTNGDVYISGTLKGQLTVAADHDINVVGDTKYSYVANGQSSGTDVLGLVANNFVQAYHPVSCLGNASLNTLPFPNDSLQPDKNTAAFADCVNLTPPGASAPLYSLTIDAAILSVRHSFEVENFQLGSQMSDGSSTNKLHIFGAIDQEFRGAVGTGGGAGGTTTGYLKDYSYDARLAKQPPPYFLSPASAPWQVETYQEQQN